MERRKKGALNGREIFMSEGFVVTDDAGAADDYEKRDDDEEAAINVGRLGGRGGLGFWEG